MFSLRAEWVGIVIVTLGLVPGAARAETARDVHRAPGAERQIARAPQTRSPLPEPLRIPAPLPEPVRPVAPAPRPDRGPVAAERPVVPRRDGDLPAEARRAARWAAERLVATSGRREYYRIGVFEGMRVALADVALGRADPAAGERSARADGEAARLGRARGRDDAWTQSRAQAERRVEDQFRTLSEEPRYEPRSATPEYEAAEFDLPSATIAGVFRDYPLSAFRPLSAQVTPYVADWGLDAASLYGCATFAEFHDAAWSDPELAFALWLDSGRAASWNRLSVEAARSRFRAEFAHELEHRLAESIEPVLEPAYERGFDDGWSYGAFVREEWQWRRGVRDGFERIATRTAQAAFRAEYAEAFEAAYAEAYDDWSHSLRPEIRRVRLLDGNDDGVFEPGEAIAVEFELVNYGGASGRLPLRLEGGVLTAPAADSVRLPARDVVRRSGALPTSIGRHVAGRTETRLRFALGADARTVPLAVRFPLQLVARTVHVSRDNLAGRVEVRVAIENLSRLPRSGTVRLSTDAAPGAMVERRFGARAGAATGSIEMALAGIDPLDLIAGDVTLRLAVSADGVVHDTLRNTLAGTAQDLSSRDLPRLLIDQARDPGLSRQRVERTRQLWLDRLRADWSAAVQARGNPYKRDYQQRGDRTALGELVRLYRHERAHVTRPEVFAGLSGEIRDLARELPGAHPFLRKYVRKLSAALP